MTSFKVSVIIPVYNGAATIRGAISAVLSQEFDGEIELIIVDDGSLDGTARIVREYKGVKCIYQYNQGPAAARNRGAHEASGELLLFTDSDCSPEPGWVQKIVNAFQDETVGVVAGSYGIANPGEVLARIIHKEIRFRHLRLMPEYPKVFGSYNFAIRAQLFRQISGFNVAYRRASGEDNDLSYRVLRTGARIRFLKEACVSHYHQHSLRRYLQEQFRHGFWRVRLYLDHSQMVSGDDYTFWKDILEVPLVVASIVSLFWPLVFMVVVLTFFLFEIIIGIWMIRPFAEGVLAGIIMWLRAFGRVGGLLSGGVFFLADQLGRGKKS